VSTLVLAAPPVVLVVWLSVHKAVKSRLTDEMAILEALPSRGQPWAYGRDLMVRAGLRGGRFYPALGRLEKAGLVEAKWDESEPEARRRRRMYRSTTLR